MAAPPTRPTLPPQRHRAQCTFRARPAFPSAPAATPPRPRVSHPPAHLLVLPRPRLHHRTTGMPAALPHCYTARARTSHRHAPAPDHGQRVVPLPSPPAPRSSPSPARHHSGTICLAPTTKPGAKKKAPAKRVPMSKPRKTTAPQETMTFTLEKSDDEEAFVGKKKKRTTATVLGKPSMREEEDEEEEERVAPLAKTQKLMENAMKSAAAPSKPKPKPKAAAPKRSTRNIQLLRRTRPQCLKFRMVMSH
nr:extensin-like [Aegilops tauschii subsp. strangulata]